MRGHPVLDGGQQGGADAPPAVFGQGGQENDPALVVRGAAHRGTHHLFALHRHHGMVLFAGGQDLGQGIHRLHVVGLETLPQVQDAVQVR